MFKFSLSADSGLVFFWWLLNRQQIKSLLADEALFREFVIRLHFCGKTMWQNIKMVMHLTGFDDGIHDYRGIEIESISGLLTMMHAYCSLQGRNCFQVLLPTERRNIPCVSKLTENLAGCAEMLGTPRLSSFCEEMKNYEGITSTELVMCIDPLVEIRSWWQGKKTNGEGVNPLSLRVKLIHQMHFAGYQVTNMNFCMASASVRCESFVNLHASMEE